jgi:tetratricopeptide (TPR) repeat protein
VWLEEVKKYTDDGQLQVVGVVQEQHPDRARLYAQWKQLDFPIFVDSLNILDFRAVPFPYLIDESGVVRAVRPKQLAVHAFMKQEYDRVDLPTSRSPWLEKYDWDKDRYMNATGEELRTIADQLFFLGEYALAADTYHRLVEVNPVKGVAPDARASFRQGVALQRLAETGELKAFQGAVAAWQKALSLDPNQYIWRRRLQQFGPRMAKPYNFYGWIETARREITERGETPVSLVTEPLGAERAEPSTTEEKVTIPDSDPDIRIEPDKLGMVSLNAVATPHTVKPGERVQVRVYAKLLEGWWNNESDELELSISPPDGVRVVSGSFHYPNPEEPETQEVRFLEFELEVDKEASAGRQVIPGYALYYVCEDKGGTCLYLRKTFMIQITIDPEAVSLK